MFWNKKKGGGKGLPDLPSSPRAVPSMRDFQIPQMPPENSPKIEAEEPEEIHSLPSFPDSPMSKGFSQSAIKDAVETEETGNQLPEVPEEKPESQISSNLPEPPKIIEMNEDWHPAETQAPEEAIPRKKTYSNKPVFVKITRFKAARQSLDEIQEKLGSIDELLKTIREVKIKEDHELASWEKEIESIKSRINTIATNIFDNPNEQ